MMHSSKIKFYNTSDSSISVNLEPWGEEFILNSGEYLIIEYSGNDEIEVESNKDSLTIYGELNVGLILTINEEVIAKKLTQEDFTAK